MHEHPEPDVETIETTERPEFSARSFGQPVPIDPEAPIRLPIHIVVTEFPVRVGYSALNE